MTRTRDTMVWRVAAIVLAVVTEVLLRTSTLPQTSRALRVVLGTEGPVAPYRSEPMPRWTAPRLMAVDAVVKRWPFGDTCLRRALLNAVVLRRLQPVVRIGWLPSVGGGNAHAWVEVAGRSLDSELDGIVPFAAR